MNKHFEWREKTYYGEKKELFIFLIYIPKPNLKMSNHHKGEFKRIKLTGSIPKG